MLRQSQGPNPGQTFNFAVRQNNVMNGHTTNLNPNTNPNPSPNMPKAFDNGSAQMRQNNFNYSQEQAFEADKMLSPPFFDEKKRQNSEDNNWMFPFESSFI